jgi:hypothetical protein
MPLPEEQDDFLVAMTLTDELQCERGYNHNAADHENTPPAEAQLSTRERPGHERSGEECQALFHVDLL